MSRPFAASATSIATTLRPTTARVIATTAMPARGSGLVADHHPATASVSAGRPTSARGRAATGAVLIVLACAALLPGCATPAVKMPPMQAAIVAVAADGRLELHTTLPALPPATPVRFQHATAGGIACCVLVRGDQWIKQPTTPTPVSDAFASGPVFRYRARAAESATGRFVALAVIGADAARSPAPAELIGSRADGSQLVIRSCSGSEGLNVQALDEEGLRAHLYYYFGYDIEPDCDPRWFERDSDRN